MFSEVLLGVLQAVRMQMVGLMVELRGTKGGGFLYLSPSPALAFTIG